MIVSLISEARSIAANAAIPDHSQQKVNEVYAAFRLIVPSTTAESLANILNAGWKAYHDPDLWKDVESVIAARSIVLKELVLKSIEVLEIEQLMAAP